MTSKNRLTVTQTELEKVLRKLRSEIYSGIRLPRERLIETELAEGFSVSRMVIRRALMQLENEGLLTIEPYKGASVSQISIKGILEKYQVISMLEGFAAYLATDRLVNKDISQMKKILREQKKLGASDVKEWQELNKQFHRTFNLKCGNDKLIQMIRLNVRFTNYWFLVLSVPGRITINVKEHENILNAIEERDACLARRLVEQHIIAAGEYLADKSRESMAVGVWLANNR